METLTQFITAINDIVWGPPMLVAILGTGLFLQLRLKCMPLTRIPAGFAMVWRGRKAVPGAPGEITPYAALMTALAARGAFRLELIDLTAQDASARVRGLRPRMLWIETPSNPLLRVTDVAAVASSYAILGHHIEFTGICGDCQHHLKDPSLN